MTGTTRGCFESCWELWRRTANASKGHGMSSSAARPSKVRFDADSMWVELSDGRVVGVPLAWFPRLLHASAAQRKRVRLAGRGLHWDALDEDISIAGLLAGLGDQARRRTAAA